MKSNFIHAAIALIAVCYTLAPSPAFAVEPLVLDRADTVYNLDDHVSILKKEAGEMSIIGVTSPSADKLFEPVDDKFPNLGFTEEPLWLKFTVENRGAADTVWLLELDYPLIGKLDLYYAQTPGGAFRTVSTGDQLPFASREIPHRNFVFHLPVAPGAAKTFYLYLHEQGTLLAPMSISARETFYINDSRHVYLLGIFFGIMGIMAVYNFLLFMALRDSNYLHYTIFITGFIMWRMFREGFGYQYLWPGSPGFNMHAGPLFGSITLVFALQFSRRFLDLKSIHQRLWIFTNAVIVMAAFLAVASYVIGYTNSAAYGQYMVFVTILTITMSGFESFRLGNRAARFFLIAFALLLFGAFVDTFSITGHIPFEHTRGYGQVVGAVFMAALLSLALADRINIMKKELYDSRLEIIKSLAMAAEYRDNETGMHILRMSRYAQAIAKHLGMGKREMDTLLNAAPMHDVGKIGIPDMILQKPGKLTPEEWVVMKTHPAIGEKLIADQPSDLLQYARTIAMNHHERWDGNGYPNGHKEEEIPLIARIVAVADVFDALTSKRPYKDPWPVDKAIDVIKEGSGSQFDADVIDAFNAALPEILEIREGNMEE